MSATVGQVKYYLMVSHTKEIQGVPKQTALQRALKAHEEAAASVIRGSVTLADLAYAAEQVALEARCAALREADDGWGTIMTFPEVVAQRVSELRATNGWTQERLAAEMSALGFDWKRITVAEVERCARRLSLDEILAIAALAEQAVIGLLSPPDAVDVEVNHVQLPAAEVFVLLSGSGGARAVSGAAHVVRALLRTAHHSPSTEEAST